VITKAKPIAVVSSRFKSKNTNSIMSTTLFTDPSSTEITAEQANESLASGRGNGGGGLDPNAVKQVLEERKRLDDKLRMQQKELEELRRLKMEQAKNHENEQRMREGLQQQQQELLQRQQDLIKKYPPPPASEAPPASPYGHHQHHQQHVQNHHRPPPKQHQQLQHPSYNNVVSPPPPQPLNNSHHPPQPPQLPHLLTMDDIQQELHPPVKVGNRNFLTLPFILWDGITMHKYPFNKTGGNPALRTFRIKHGNASESGFECVITGGGYNKFFCEKYNTQGGEAERGAKDGWAEGWSEVTASVIPNRPSSRFARTPLTRRFAPRPALRFAHCSFKNGPCTPATGMVRFQEAKGAGEI